MPLIGTQAPDFTAKAVIGDDIVDYRLSSNWTEGKYTLLFFYPKDFTFVCPTELIAFDQALAAFKDRNVEVVACSTDQEFSHHAWNRMPRDEGGLGGVRYPIVADTTKDIAKAFDVLAPTGVAFRGLFLIDASGTVRHMVVNDMPLGRSVKEALRMVDALHFNERHGEVCPADWQQGELTIKANPKDAKEYFQAAHGNGMAAGA
jgi:peroxiredoxin (alkyl hydroperoxide reductase subunit C)